MCELLGYFVYLLLVMPSVYADADNGCVSPVTLLEGRRRIDGAVMSASNSMKSHSSSEARLDDSGWCSGQLGGNIFNPWLEVNFSTNVLFTAIVTKGVAVTPLTEELFLECYQLELAREDGQLLYLAKPSNSSQPEKAIFPLEQSRITSGNQYKEQLPIPVIGQTLRIDPYEWDDNDHACTKLEVYGCPLQECQEEHQLGNDADTVVTVNGAQIDHDDLFNFDFNAHRYCIPTDEIPPTFVISYPSSVSLMEIAIRGSSGSVPMSSEYVKSFSLSYAVGDNFTAYTRSNGLTTFNVPDCQSYYFGLWPPIRTTKLKVIIHDWQSRPCLNFWMSGCDSNDVVEHSIDPSAPNAGLVDNLVVTKTITMTQTTTIVVTTTVTDSSSQLTTTVTSLPSQVTVTVTDSPSEASTTFMSLSLQSITLKPTSTQDTSIVCSHNHDDGNITPVYILIAIVTVGIVVTAVIITVGVIICRRHSHGHMQSAKSSDPLLPKGYGSINLVPSSIVEVDNDLYGQQELQMRRLEEQSDETYPLHDEPTHNGNDRPVYEEIVHSGEYPTDEIYAEPRKT